MFVTPHLRPSTDQLARLSPFERFAFNVIDTFNAIPVIKGTSNAVARWAWPRVVIQSTRHLTHVVGMERLRDFVPQRGVLLASNHRTFFDQHVISAYLMRYTPLIRSFYYPVRSEFFYEKAVGLFVNLFGTAMSMYPPIFRSPEKRAFNTYSVKRLSELLQWPKNAVGVFPEGTRNKGEDPYTLLPAQPGIGKLAMHNSPPHILPVFVNGIPLRLREQLRNNWHRKGPPIIIVYDRPIDISAFAERKNTLRAQKELADYVLEHIRQLGEKERGFRAKLTEITRDKRGVAFHTFEELEG